RHTTPRSPSAVPADPFGRSIDNYMRDMFQRLEQIPAGTESIAYDKWQVMFSCDGSYFFEVRNVVARVADCFDIDGFRAFVYKFFNIVSVGVSSKTCLNS